LVQAHVGYSGRGGRKTSEKVIELMEEEFEKALPCWLGRGDDEPTP